MFPPFLRILLILLFSAAFTLSLFGVETAPSLASLDAQWEAQYSQGPRLGSEGQTLARILVEGSQLGWRTDRLLQVLSWLEEMRQGNPAKPNYNNLLWYWGDTQVDDPNSVEFITRLAVLTLTLAPAGLDPQVLSRTQAFLRTNLDGIRRHQVPLTYTNIVLMKAWNLVALGDSLSDPGAAEAGAQLLALWLAEVRKNGIREFLSPTYSTVDLENLGLLRRFARDPKVQADAQKGLDYLWAVTRTYWFLPSDRLGGTHSRDYDRLFGHGSLDLWYKKSRDSVDFTDFLDRLAWTQPSKQAALPPLASGSTAVLRWAPDKASIWYRGENYGIGSSTDNFFNMDKTPLLADLGPDKTTPQISFWMDAREDYYGLNLIKEGSGHRKSLHLRPFLAAAQNENEVLFFASDNSEGGAGVESTFILPSEASYYLDGKELKPFHHRSLWTENPPPQDPFTSIRVEQVGAKVELVLEDKATDRGVGVERILPVTPGHKYRTLLVGRGGDVSIYHNYLDSGGNLIGSENLKVLKGSDANQQGTLETLAPAGAVSVRAWIYSTLGNVGTFHLSSVRVDDVSGAQPVNLAAFDWQINPPFLKAVKDGQTLALRLGKAALAIRPLRVLGANGRPASFVLVNDGVDYGAFRLSSVQSPTETQNRATTLVYVTAFDVADDASFQDRLAKITTLPYEMDVEGKTFEVSVHGLGGRLSIQLDGAAKKKTLVPEPFPTKEGTFWIDGKEVGAGFLGP